MASRFSDARGEVRRVGRIERQLGAIGKGERDHTLGERYGGVEGQRRLVYSQGGTLGKPWVSGLGVVDKLLMNGAEVFSDAGGTRILSGVSTGVFAHEPSSRLERIGE